MGFVALQPQSVAEVSPRIMQIRFMVLRPFASSAGRLLTSFRTRANFDSIVNRQITTLPDVTNRIAFLSDALLPSPCFHTSLK